jgi:hypothetical protein
LPLVVLLFCLVDFRGTVELAEETVFWHLGTLGGNEQTLFTSSSISVSLESENSRKPFNGNRRAAWFSLLLLSEGS